MGVCLDPSIDISEIEGYQSALSEASLRAKRKLGLYLQQSDVTTG